MSSSTSESPVDPFLTDSFSQSSMEIIKFSHLWTIKNFSFCVDEEKIESPSFGARSDSGTQWCLALKPRGMKKEDKDYVSLHLCRLSSEPAELKAKFEISLLNADRRELRTWISDKLCAFTMEERHDGWGWKEFTPLDSLLESDGANLPSDKLIVRCEVSYTLGIKNTPSQETHIQSDCDSLGLLRELHENPMLSDVLLSCNGKDIPAHRVVLGARSAILKAMFEQDLGERKMSNIDIVDMGEQTLRDLLRFIYTGEADVPDNMRNLLDTIDKHARRRS